MAVNPALQPPGGETNIERSNKLNDPQYYNQEGYNSFNLDATHMVTPRFGEVTPTFVCETVPGDRHALLDTSLHRLNQIDAPMFSKVNNYTDFIYVPFRQIMPNNYEKLIPNPTKGDDLPTKAEPMIPLLHMLQLLFKSTSVLNYVDHTNGDKIEVIPAQLDWDEIDKYDHSTQQYMLNALIYASYVLSRGSLLDYLGYCPDLRPAASELDTYNPRYLNPLQQAIDDFWQSLVPLPEDYDLDARDLSVYLVGIDPSEATPGVSGGVGPNVVALPGDTLAYRSTKLRYHSTLDQFNLSGFRGALYDVIERGLFFELSVFFVEDRQVLPTRVEDAARNLYNALQRVLPVNYTIYTDPAGQVVFNNAYINPLRPAAYQLAIAELFTNDQVDNIFTAELYMQHLRSLMFPADSTGLSAEPTFDYNGVATEYDLLTVGAFEASFLEDNNIYAQSRMLRVFPLLSSLFGMRRSLRYGDYFATGRPNMLAVGGQMSIPVVDGKVDPLEVNSGLLLARYKNASNWIGSKYSNYMPSIFGVQPSDQGSRPYWIANRHIELGKDIVENTGDNQGFQVTNLSGTSDNTGIDVFIDDFGVIVGVTSYDALPIYPSGIDRHFKAHDRFELFNSMLQNLGDQAIHQSELTGFVTGDDEPFAYVVRYAQYKMTSSRAHGAFVNQLPGFAMLYPYRSLSGIDALGDLDLHINPDFIRDKPFYFDQFFKSRTGMSPGTYYHFWTGVTNVHDAARKMQYTPLVL